MNKFKENFKGVLLCIAIAIPAFILGKQFPIIGGPVFGIIFGMLLTQFINTSGSIKSGITYTSKKILQYAVILLGFGLNLSVILETGTESLPIILSTISTSLLVAYILYKITGQTIISTLIVIGAITVSVISLIKGNNNFSMVDVIKNYAKFEFMQKNYKYKRI